MKKKMVLGIVAVTIIAGAFVFANNVTRDSEFCPDRPGCICSKAATEQQVAKPIAAADTKEKCRDTEKCVCK